MIKCKAYKKRRNETKFLNGFYETLKQELMGSSKGLTESDILQKFLSDSSVKSDDLRRDEYTFRQTVWPKLEDMRKKDKQKILANEKLEYGRSVKVWKLKF